jgi:hypothetical protein
MLESRRLLSVPNYAGSWSGTLTGTSQGHSRTGAEQLRCRQRGTTVSCTVTGEFATGPADYLKGKIDTRGRLKFAVRDTASSPVTVSGMARIKRGHLTMSFSGQTSDGDPLTGTGSFTKTR